MFSQAVEYSLRAMVLLSQQAGRPLTVQAIAQRGQIPGPYLSKLLQGLARANLVISQRGIGGGYSLARDPAQITLAHVMNSVEPLQRIKTCPLGIEGHLKLCPLHRILDQALCDIERTFQNTTLADLVRETSGSIPLCSSQPVVAIDLAARAHGDSARSSPQ